MHKNDKPDHFAKEFKKGYLLKWHPKFGHFAKKPIYKLLCPSQTDPLPTLFGLIPFLNFN